MHITVGRTDPPAKLEMKLDDVMAGPMVIPPQRGRGGRPLGGGAGGRALPTTLVASLTVHLDRGPHTFSVLAGGSATIQDLAVEEKPGEASSERRALHFRLLGSERARNRTTPQDRPADPRPASYRAPTAVPLNLRKSTAFWFCTIGLPKKRSL